MRFLAAMSTVRAVVIALAWPALIFGLPALLSIVLANADLLTGGRIHIETFRRQVPGTEWIGLLLVLGPPLIFLISWAIVRRNATR